MSFGLIIHAHRVTVVEMCGVWGSKKEGGGGIKDKTGGSGLAVMEMSGGHWWWREYKYASIAL